MTDSSWVNNTDTVQRFTSDGVLFNLLPAWRPKEPTLANHLYTWVKAEAERQSVAGEQVLTDEQYNDIVRDRPTSLEALADIITQKKALRYGEALLELMRRYGG